MYRTVALTYQQIRDKELKQHFGIIVRTSKINGSVNIDLFNEQLLNFYKAKENFDKKKGAKFSTYLYTFLKSRKSNYIRDKFTKNNEVELKKEFLEQIPSNENIENNFINQEDSKRILDEINKLDEKGKYIIEQKLLEDRTFVSISEDLKCSSQNVRQIFYNRLEKLKSKLVV